VANWLDDLRKRFKPKIGGNSAGVVALDDEHVVAAYARWAPVYDQVFGVITTSGRRAAVAVVNLMPASRVLELGVGTGISLPSYDRAHRIVGIDLSPDMLARAERRVGEKRLDHVEALLEMDASRLALGDQSFDVGVAMFVMTVVPEPRRVLAELARVVKPGGRVVLVNHFSVEKGVRATVERWLGRFAAALGWNPEFPIEEVLGRPDLKLVEARRVAPFGLFTLLVFERL
jgi:phosphatidylethanolamine/phosphatidyl-N-methylethanolamine N-methyltransferase